MPQAVQPYLCIIESRKESICVICDVVPLSTEILDIGHHRHGWNGLVAVLVASKGPVSRQAACGVPQLSGTAPMPAGSCSAQPQQGKQGCQVAGLGSSKVLGVFAHSAGGTIVTACDAKPLHDAADAVSSSGHFAGALLTFLQYGSATAVQSSRNPPFCNQQHHSHVYGVGHLAMVVLLVPIKHLVQPLQP